MTERGRITHAIFPRESSPPQTNERKRVWSSIMDRCNNHSAPQPGHTLCFALLCTRKLRLHINVHMYPCRLWTGCDFICSAYDDGKDASFYMCHDRIGSLTMANLTTGGSRLDAVLGCEASAQTSYPVHSLIVVVVHPTPECLAASSV